MADEYVAYNGPVVTRKEAQEQGLKRYFEGADKFCSHGHISERLVSNTGCCACAREACRAYDRRKGAPAPISPRAEARGARQTRYWTGIPCPAGHVGDRITASGACYECTREAEREKRKKESEERELYEKAQRESLGLSSRADARNSGAKTYFTGKPCVNGHVDIRLTINGNCKSCADALRPLIKENSKETDRLYRITNRETINARTSQWQKANPEKGRAKTARYNARKRGAEGDWTEEDIQRIGALQGWRCSWCKKPCKDDFHADHFVPLSKNGSNLPKNLVISCPTCNQRKHAKPPEQFAREMGYLI